MWSSPGSLYRPLALTMFAAEWGISPDNPSLYHFLNVFFYALTGWALWITWRRVLADYPPVLPALATLFFMAHPTHVEVVANIKSRDEIMAFLGCTYALYCVWRYLEARKTTWLAAGVAIYFAALFFKEGAITFVAFIVLALHFFSREKMGVILRIGALFVAPALVFFTHQTQRFVQTERTGSIFDTGQFHSRRPISGRTHCFGADDERKVCLCIGISGYSGARFGIPAIQTCESRRLASAREPAYFWRSRIMGFAPTQTKASAFLCHFDILSGLFSIFKSDHYDRNIVW